MSIRIIAGEFKGRRLRSVPGVKIRPTAERIREAIFDILGRRVRGAVVLDLFAGTGALGIEALSRGASSAVFVDIGKDATAVLRTNIKSIQLEHRTKVIQWDLTQNLNCLVTLPFRFNLAFMDPPYRQNMVGRALIHVHKSRCLETGACIIVEHSYREPIPETSPPFELKDQRKYGKTLVSFFDYML